MIETKRLTIKPFSMEDFDIIYKLYSDEEIMKYMPMDCLDEEGAKKHLEKIVNAWKKEKPTDCEMLVCKKDSGEKIGRCRIHIDYSFNSGMIGWLILKEHWNNGYAAEITKALIDYAFDELKLHRVYALCNPNNAQSCRVLEKCNMRREGYFKGKCPYIKKGVTSWQDEAEYAIIETER